jgi:thioesterase domain-containing protein
MLLYPVSSIHLSMSLDRLTKTLQQDLLRQIPISQALGITVAEASLDEIAIAAPLNPNLNHRGTAFGGSIAALAILSGWSLVYIRLEAVNEKPIIVIQHSEVRYLKPILGPFTARAHLTDARKWSHFRESLSRHGKARIKVTVEIDAETGLAAAFRGVYVALRSPG